jgi:hypothetical protein
MDNLSAWENYLESNNERKQAYIEREAERIERMVMLMSLEDLIDECDLHNIDVGQALQVDEIEPVINGCEGTREMAFETLVPMLVETMVEEAAQAFDVEDL